LSRSHHSSQKILFADHNSREINSADHTSLKIGPQSLEVSKIKEKMRKTSKN
jgi:hypothetical protein